MNHKEFAEEIGPIAARLNGQDWGSLSLSSKQIIIDTIRNISSNGGQTPFEKACGRAIAEWYEGKRGKVVTPPKPPSRKSKQKE